MLSTTIGEDGRATQAQHLSCLVIDDCVAVDAGSLAMAVSDKQRENIRDIVLTHAHLDHIAGLPLFVDDLFATTKRPITIHATREVEEVLENDVFNWRVYPRFSELKNEFGAVLRYARIDPEEEFEVRHLRFKPVEVNHKVPTTGFIISDANTRIGLTSDTSKAENFWRVLNAERELNALFIECAFPDSLQELASAAFHMTPNILRRELEKSKQAIGRILVINLKPTYREQIIKEIKSLKIPKVEILEVGKAYEF